MVKDRNLEVKGKKLKSKEKSQNLKGRRNKVKAKGKSKR